MKNSLSLFAHLCLTSVCFAQQKTTSAKGSISGGFGAPEIDVTFLGIALALVVGGVFVFTTARRKRLATSRES